jgi:uncharacterized protein YpmB
MKNKIIKNRLALLGLFCTIIIGLISYYGKSMIGFPDGHRTEYDKFDEKILYPIFFCLNTLFLFAFIISFYTNKKIKLIFILYIIVLVLFQITQYYFSVNLENGQGG